MQLTDTSAIPWAQGVRFMVRLVHGCRNLSQAACTRPALYKKGWCGLSSNLCVPAVKSVASYNPQPYPAPALVLMCSLAAQIQQFNKS